ncbi:uncharacterized protein LOC121384053 [Gigantopelta aegis]|uniref:uncharacterized protein LOC121384053 n=1 Tax=Gigantopelta aegis TaxID=1735272 RepID=UPI001B88CE68|nr:uncharacterized protein LOC121384053 [Gigantopelta aegis]
MWQKYKTNGNEITEKIKTFFGVLDTNEDMDNLRKNFESRVRKENYGISIQKSIPEFMQTESYKKDMAIDQMKEAFSQLSVDQLTESEIQELIKSSTGCIIRSSQSVPYSSNVDTPGPSSRSVHLPCPSEKREKAQTTVAIPSFDAMEKKRSQGVTKATLDKTEDEQIEIVCSPAECHSQVRKFSKSTTTAKSSDGFKSKISFALRNLRRDSSSETWNMETSSLLNRPSFQSSIRQKYSKKPLSGSKIHFQEPASKNVHLYSLEEFVHITNILNDEELQKLEVNSENASWLSSVLSFSHGTNDAEKYVGLAGNETFYEHKEKPVASCSTSEERPCSIKVETIGTLTSCSNEYESPGKLVYSDSGNIGQSDVHSFVGSGSTEWTSSSAASRSKSEQSDINNSAVYFKSNKVHPIDFTASGTHGPQMNVNNHAIGEMDVNNHAVGGSMGEIKSETTDGGNNRSNNYDSNINDKKVTSNDDGPAETDADDTTRRRHHSSPTKKDVKNSDLSNVRLIEDHSELTGQEALKHYKLFAAVERAVLINKLEQIKEQITSDYLWKIDVVEEIYETAKAYYSNPEGEARSKWKKLRREISQYSKESITDIRVKLTTFGNFRPFFTYLILLSLVMSVSVICALFGLARVGLEPKLDFEENIKTFLGKESIHRWIVPNLWMGPTMRSMIAAGAVFGLCMRENHHTSLAFVERYNFSITTTLGCCEMASRNTAGTLSKEECNKETEGVGAWREGILCSGRIPGKNSVAHVMKPCCVDIQGMCIHTSHSHCVFIGGIYHMKEDHCSQVNCANDLCHFGGLEPDPDMPWLSKKANQWGRFLLSLLYSHGIIHTILLLVGIWILMRETEKTIGWMRMLFVYISCGLNGCLIATIFSPYSPQVGTTGSLMGTVGVLTVELSQAWRLVKKPWKEVAKIAGLLCISLFVGTFPQVSNYSIVVGFFTGMICAVTFLPYITFGWWRPQTRLILCITGLALLMLSHFIFFYLFYYVQDLTQCKSCTAFDCMPYTDKVCDFNLLEYHKDDL